MLRRARDRVAGLPPEGQARVRLEQAPAERLRFDDSKFDTVVCTLVLCTVDDPAKAIAEVRRLLKPGGELRFVEHVAGAGAAGTIQRLIQPLWGWTAGGCRLRRDTEGALRDAGFDVQVEERLKLSPILPAIRGIARR
jgi:SAM-dependent methyltransferase